MTRTRIILCLLMALALGDFAFRAVIPAYAYDKNDFSDPYCASWLWLHGQNPYDVGLATRVNHDLAHTDAKIVPVYPATAYVLVSPLSLLPWRFANLLWALLGVVAVSLMRTCSRELQDFRFARTGHGFLLRAFSAPRLCTPACTWRIPRRLRLVYVFWQFISPDGI